MGDGVALVLDLAEAIVTRSAFAQAGAQLAEGLLDERGLLLEEVEESRFARDKAEPQFNTPG